MATPFITDSEATGAADAAARQCDGRTSWNRAPCGVASS
jgi:hypothetical protein